MRVRYGKPIKVKSLLGNQTSLRLDTSLTNADQLCFYNGVYSYTRSYNSDLFSGLNLTQNHKYYFYILGSGFSNNVLRGYTYIYEGSTIYLDEHPDTITRTDTEADSIWQFTQKSPTNVTKFYVGKLNGSTPLVKYFFLLDLTDIYGSGNEPSRNDFYNKYNKYFPLIATGEEITVDDKAGQIAYKNLEEDSIRCKVAGGSSDIYYGYNQLIQPKDTYTSRGITFTKNEDQSITITGTTSETVWYTYNLLSSNHKYFARIVADNTTSVVDWYVGGNYLYLSSASTQEAIINNPANTSVNVNVRNGFNGPLIIKLEIIDLTDWFGSGNEPTTVAEFKQKFAKEYYGYCPTAIKLTQYQIEALPNYGYNQVCPLTKPGGNWGSVAISEDGIITYTVTGTGNAAGVYRQLYSNGATANHKYYMSALVKSSFNTTDTNFVFDGKYTGSYKYQLTANQWTKLENMITVATPSTASGVAGYNYIYIQMSNPLAGVGNTLQIKEWQFIDLTDWYGSGNEPSTVEEFKQTFPNLYYPYSKKRLLNKYMINKLID